MLERPNRNDIPFIRTLAWDRRQKQSGGENALSPEVKSKVGARVIGPLTAIIPAPVFAPLVFAPFLPAPGICAPLAPFVLSPFAVLVPGSVTIVTIIVPIATSVVTVLRECGLWQGCRSQCG
jgi:hypothetical protein